MYACMHVITRLYVLTHVYFHIYTHVPTGWKYRSDQGQLRHFGVLSSAGIHIYIYKYNTITDLLRCESKFGEASLAVARSHTLIVSRIYNLQEPFDNPYNCCECETLP